MSTVIIDYGSGNLRSAAKALQRAAGEGRHRRPVLVSADPVAVAAAARIVLPGVGAFADCRRGLAAVPGMTAALINAVIEARKPFLGICVGMQLMADVGREHGAHQGLGWVKGDVVALAPADKSLKIPHMGWNDLILAAPGHPMLAGLSTGEHAYFVHSYHMLCADAADVLATVDYGGPVAAVIGRANMVGTQFHPEKSQAVGLRLLANFLDWTPAIEGAAS